MNRGETVSGDRSRNTILDVAERLMANHGYGGTSIAAIRSESGLPASSIYWHFGSKQGVLAAVMERGAQRWFAALRDEMARLDVLPQDQRAMQSLRVLGAALVAYPEFLRLFYVLSLEHTEDERVREVVARVRGEAVARWREGIERLVPPGVPSDRRARAVDRLSRLAVAVADGAFLAEYLDPDADLQALMDQLSVLLPAALALELAT
jgi:AcrR family transcriptional regulator